MKRLWLLLLALPVALALTSQPKTAEADIQCTPAFCADCASVGGYCVQHSVCLCFIEP